MLKMNLIDCEHWDIISVWKGEHNLTDKERSVIEGKITEPMTPVEEIEWALTNQKPVRAYLIAQRKEREISGWTLPQELHLKIIQQFFVLKHWEAAAASMRQYLERYKIQASSVRMMLAQALLAQNKPKSAIKVLASITTKEFGAEQHTSIKNIQAEAEAMHQKNTDEGICEIVE
jgi:hypothetical protein